MGITLINATRRALRRAAGRRHGFSGLVLLASVLIGGGMALWARTSLDALLEIRPVAEIAVTLEASDGLCGTPSLYMVPETATARASDYSLLVDFLGGPDRFPELGGAAARSVLALPETRRPGVGLGRGLPEHCEAMRLRIDGDVARFEPVEIPQNVTFLQDGEGIALDYRQSDAPRPEDALARFVLRGVPDSWQFGHKRATFLNGGSEGINIFLYEEPGYLFLNENFAFVRPPNVRRSYVDIHLEQMGGRFASSADVVRRRPTADLELQRALINFSTLFGIGISLLVEGLLIGLVSLADTKRQPGGKGRADDE
jgi:hypothetical protein